MTVKLFYKTWSYTVLGYSIYLRAAASLDYDTAREYLMTIDCTDTKETVRSTYVVYVAKNEPPVISNLPASKNIRMRLLLQPNTCKIHLLSHQNMSNV